MKFDFADKESYLHWRQEWRVNYIRLSREIRAMKRRRKLYLRRYERLVTPMGRVRKLVSKVANPDHGPAWGLLDLQLQATFELERLKEAKALSWRLRQERLAVSIA